jgi:hypothetical protein
MKRISLLEVLDTTIEEGCVRAIERDGMAPITNAIASRLASHEMLLDLLVSRFI